MIYALLSVGLLAGFIDAIAGGGGLLTLPALLWALGSGPDAVGTNKIIGLSAALAALWVYRRAGHLRLGDGLRFSAAVGVGAIGGSLITPLLPAILFQWFVLFISPLIFWIIGRKEIWVAATRSDPSANSTRGIWWGVLAGFYDGMWGPGGGTFLFLVLFLGAKLPLMQAIAASKMANAFSAGFSLISFSLRGYVHWSIGVWMAGAVVVGALAGAQLASRSSAKVVRPILGVVSLLLVLKVVFW